MDTKSEFVNVGLGHYLMLDATSNSLLNGLNGIEGLFLAYYIDSPDHIHFMTLDNSTEAIDIYSLNFSDISTQQVTFLNTFVSDKQKELVHSSGLYTHHNMIRCELTFIVNDLRNLPTEEGYSWSNFGINCETVRVSL